MKLKFWQELLSTILFLHDEDVSFVPELLELKRLHVVLQLTVTREMKNKRAFVEDLLHIAHRSAYLSRLDVSVVSVQGLPELRPFACAVQLVNVNVLVAVVALNDEGRGKHECKVLHFVDVLLEFEHLAEQLLIIVDAILSSQE